MPLNPASPVYGKTITGANQAIGCTTPVAATDALTLSGNANEGETFTVGGIVYIWTAIAANYTGQTANYVKIGADAATSIVNGTAAITGTDSKGTLFSNGTKPNPLVTATATSSTVLTVTATNQGADGNGVPVSETMASATWGSTTTLGGVSASLNVDIATAVGTQDVNLTKVGGTSVALGSTTAAASIPVALASDQIGTATAPSTAVVTTRRPAVTQVVSTALETSHVLKASAGSLTTLVIFNSKASAQFILLMNATSLPSNGAVTLLYPPIPINAGSTVQLDLPTPLVASTGIVVANSSTGTFSLTIGGSDCAFYAQVN